LIWLHIKVERSFKGVQENIIKVLTYINTSCDLDVKKGERWIFYASRDKSGNLGVGACSGTTKISRNENAQYLNEVAAAVQDKNIESVNGFVFKEPYTGKQINGAIVNVEGADFFTSTATNSQGLFSIRVPQAGKYKVRITIPFRANVLEVPFGIEPNLTQTFEPTETKSVFAYETIVPQGQCQYSEIGFFPIGLKSAVGKMK
jgi:hypothetical protein